MIRPDVTLCGWQDVKMYTVTNQLSLLNPIRLRGGMLGGWLMHPAGSL